MPWYTKSPWAVNASSWRSVVEESAPRRTRNPKPPQGGEALEIGSGWTTPWKFNIAPENIPCEKESSLPTIIFQGYVATLNFGRVPFLSLIMEVEKYQNTMKGKEDWKDPFPTPMIVGEKVLYTYSISSTFNYLKWCKLRILLVGVFQISGLCAIENNRKDEDNIRIPLGISPGPCAHIL